MSQRNPAIKLAESFFQPLIELYGDGRPNSGVARQACSHPAEGYSNRRTRCQVVSADDSPEVIHFRYHHSGGWKYICGMQQRLAG